MFLKAVYTTPNFSIYLFILSLSILATIFWAKYNFSQFFYV